MTTITKTLKANGIESIEFLDILRLRNRFPEIDPDEILKLACAKIKSDSDLSRWRQALLEWAVDKYGVPYHPYKRLLIEKLEKDFPPTTAKAAFDELQGVVYGENPDKGLLPIMFIAKAASHDTDKIYDICQDLVQADVSQNFEDPVNRKVEVLDTCIDLLINVLESTPDQTYLKSDTKGIKTVRLTCAEDMPGLYQWEASALDAEGNTLIQAIIGDQQDPRPDLLNLEADAMRILGLWGGEYTFEVELPSMTYQGRSFIPKRLIKQTGLQEGTGHEEEGITWISWGANNSPSIEFNNDVRQEFAIALIDSARRVVRKDYVISHWDHTSGFAEIWKHPNMKNGFYLYTLGCGDVIRIGIPRSIQGVSKKGYSLLVIPVSQESDTWEWHNPWVGGQITADWVGDYLKALPPEAGYSREDFLDLENTFTADEIDKAFTDKGKQTLTLKELLQAEHIHPKSRWYGVRRLLNYDQMSAWALAVAHRLQNDPDAYQRDKQAALKHITWHERYNDHVKVQKDKVRQSVRETLLDCEFADVREWAKEWLAKDPADFACGYYRGMSKLEKHIEENWPSKTEYLRIFGSIRLNWEEIRRPSLFMWGVTISETSRPKDLYKTREKVQSQIDDLISILD